MLGLLVGSLLSMPGHLGIALAMGDASHGQVHTDLRALALKVGAQVGNDVLGDALHLGDAHDVLGSPLELALPPASGNENRERRTGGT